MSQDQWDQKRGWTLVAIHLAVRGAIVFALSVLALLVFVRAVGALETDTVAGELPIIAGIAVGFLAGLVLSWGLVNRTGISGRTLIVPVYVLVVALAVGAYNLGVAMYPDWRDVLAYLFGALGAAAVLTAGAKLWLQS